MTSKIVGSIVATDTKSGLKTVLHVHKNGGTITFTKPDNPDWSHQCHPSHEKNPEGWVAEVDTIFGTTFKDAQFFPVSS